jgi:8-oxo-dGTP pyrophosphatase MutT (NUDIX family)
MDSKNLTRRKPININGAGVLIIDKDKRVLLQLRNDSEFWGIPGGCLKVGKSLQNAAIKC